MTSIVEMPHRRLPSLPAREVFDGKKTKCSSWIYLSMADADRMSPCQTPTYSSSIDLFRSREKSSNMELFPGKKRFSVCSSASIVSCKMSSFPQQVGSQMWQDNPERDRFSTFSVSENDLTNVIEVLEKQLDVQRCRVVSESSDNVINTVQDDFKMVISPKVTFILDTYCSMYMYR